ncbi:MAG TPA: glycine cleavage T C-terminal barrel domain-containing protein [Vicinamibacterales bacterium]|nr:glycine cleavage T C-terminal barrel domain-containing protein [Vicinamibacterales bacterium]
MPDITAEYRIIETAAGLVDRSHHGRLRFDGPDAQPFLQSLLTNDLAAMDERRGLYAALLSPQGRMIADARLFMRGDAVLADVAPGTAAALAARLDALIFSEDVRVTDVTAGTAVVVVAGTAAPEVVARAFDLDAQLLDALAPLHQVPARAGAWIVRSDESARAMFDVWVDAADREATSARLTGAGAVPVSRDLADLLRIEAGRPAFGVDMTTDTIPLEAGLLDRAISTTKGCYVGQEVIIRVLHRGGGRVARRLVQLVLDASAAGTDVPAPGTPIARDGADVGRITSAAWSPAAGRVVALGYVARDQATAGARCHVAMPAGEAGAEITGLAG